MVGHSNSCSYGLDHLKTNYSNSNYSIGYLNKMAAILLGFPMVLVKMVAILFKTEHHWKTKRQWKTKQRATIGILNV